MGPFLSRTASGKPDYTRANRQKQKNPRCAICTPRVWTAEKPSAYDRVGGRAAGHSPPVRFRCIAARQGRRGHGLHTRRAFICAWAANLSPPPGTSWITHRQVYSQRWAISPHWRSDHSVISRSSSSRITRRQARKSRCPQPTCGRATGPPCADRLSRITRRQARKNKCPQPTCGRATGPPRADRLSRIARRRRGKADVHSLHVVELPAPLPPIAYHESPAAGADAAKPWVGNRLKYSRVPGS